MLRREDRGYIRGGIGTAGSIFRFDTEEQKIGIVTLFTSVVMVITVWMTVANVDKSLVWYLVGGYVLFTAIIVAANIYERHVKKVKPEPQDERSAQCSLKATRNAYLSGLVLMAVFMIVGQIGAPLEKMMAFQIVFGISMAVYTMSYLYYKGFE